MKYPVYKLAAVLLAGGGALIVMGTQVFAQAYSPDPYYSSNSYSNYYYPQYPSPVQSPQGSLSLNLYLGPPSTRLTVSGSAFPRNAPVIIYFGPVAVTSIYSDSNGSFQAPVSVPNLPPGVVSVTATGAISSNPPKFSITGIQPVVVAPGPIVNPVVRPIRTPIPPPAYPYPNQNVAAFQGQITSLQRQVADLTAQLNACQNYSRTPW